MTMRVLVNVRMSVDDRVALKAAAGRAGVSVSEWVRLQIDAADTGSCVRCKDVPAWKLKAKVQDHDLPAVQVPAVVDDNPWAHLGDPLDEVS